MTGLRTRYLIFTSLVPITITWTPHSHAHRAHDESPEYTDRQISDWLRLRLRRKQRLEDSQRNWEEIGIQWSVSPTNQIG